MGLVNSGAVKLSANSGTPFGSAVKSRQVIQELV